MQQRPLSLTHCLSLLLVLLCACVQAHVSRLLAPSASSRRHVRRSVLCSTLAGNECDLLTITDFNDGDPDGKAMATMRP